MDGDVRSSSDEISDSSVDNGTASHANGTKSHTKQSNDAIKQNGTPKKLAENGSAKTTSLQSDDSTPLTAQ